MICHNMDNRNSSKFTKGEKCIFAHLVFTFSIILIIVIIYLTHLYVVEHSLSQVFDTRKSILAKKGHPVVEYLPIGIIFLNQTSIRNVCNILLLSWRWSHAPAHCLSMRSDPDLSHLLSAWRVRYPYNKDKNIKRSLIHPHFDSDTFANNIGLLQHDSIHNLYEYRIMNSNELLSDKIHIASWNDKGHYDERKLETYSVTLLEEKKCTTHLTQVLDLRHYEFCVELQDKINISLVLGAPIIHIRNKHIIGFFTWGEQTPHTLPMVILNITHYKKWLDTVIL